MTRPGVKIDSNQFAYAARDISQVEAVVQSYKVAVAPYTSSKNQMFKQCLPRKLQELLGPVGLIRNGLMNLITSIVRKMARNDKPLRPTLSFYFVRCVEALAVYGLMYEYIKSGKLIQITSEDAQARISELLQGKPNWRSVANHDDVNSLFREFAFGCGGTDNGGPPPGPPPGGASGFQPSSAFNLGPPGEPPGEPPGGPPGEQPGEPPGGPPGPPSQSSSSSHNIPPPPPPPDPQGVHINPIIKQRGRPPRREPPEIGVNI